MRTQAPAAQIAGQLGHVRGFHCLLLDKTKSPKFSHVIIDRTHACAWRARFFLERSTGDEFCVPSASASAS